MYNFCKDVLIHVWCCVPVGSNFYRFNKCEFQFGISKKIAGPGPFSSSFSRVKKQAFKQHVTQSREMKQPYVSVIFFS